METLSEKLQSVYRNVYVFEMPKKKPNYSKPKIYTGGIDISKWNKLTKKQKESALEKRWYIYFSFRNPQTGKLEPQTPLTCKVNHFKTKEERLEILKAYQKALEQILREGYNPYEKRVIEEINNENITFSKACSLFLKEKIKTVKHRTYKDLERRLDKFSDFLKARYFSTDLLITAITKKMVMNYLDVILKNSSPRTRNNIRVDLNTFFGWFHKIICLKILLRLSPY